MKKTSLLFALLLLCYYSEAGHKIKCYFNQPVDTTVATFEKAAYLKNCIADTVAAYISRAKYTLDICQYDFDKTISYNISTLDTQFAPEIAAAIDSAFKRGVKVRYIYEASNANTGLTLLDSGIHTLGSPQGSNYTIMHNKFMVIDAFSSKPEDAIVWTGCLNWYYEQFNWDFNNVVIVQDSALAHAYTGEFNMMWGDTGIVPNRTVSKFGQYKTDLGRHIFNVDGSIIELYFSPSDGTDNHIQSTIATANTDLYFGMYTFTEHNDANMIVNKYDSGVYVSGINDSYSTGYYGTTTFTSYLGTRFKIYNGTDTTLYHNKFLIVDPSDTCSDPIVLTGSHNWTTSANTKNDENTLIIHDKRIANLYYQYFKATFNSLGGTLAHQTGCKVVDTNTGVLPLSENEFIAAIYPNPSAGEFILSYHLAVSMTVTVDIFNAFGQKIRTLVNKTLNRPGTYKVDFAIDEPGVYFAKINSENGCKYMRFVIYGK